MIDESAEPNPHLPKTMPKSGIVCKCYENGMDLTPMQETGVRKTNGRRVSREYECPSCGARIEINDGETWVGYYLKKLLP